jgi:hypothetical protein
MIRVLSGLSFHRKSPTGGQNRVNMSASDRDCRDRHVGFEKRTFR